MTKPLEHQLPSTSKSASEHVACADVGCCESLNRRQFVSLASAGLTAVAAGGVAAAVAGPFDGTEHVDHFVPADKKLQAAWVQALFAKGERTWYAGDDLKTIGMPVGGVCAGQVYLTGDGRLVYWDIFNQNVNSGYGQVNYKAGRAPTEMVRAGRFSEAPAVEQGVAVRVVSDGKAVVRRLCQKDFPAVRFRGEYPIGCVDYEDPAFPLSIRLEAFSPFIPLNADDSMLPATLMNYTLKNTSNRPLTATLAGWLQNAVCVFSAQRLAGSAVRVNQVQRGNGLVLVSASVKSLENQPSQPPRPPIVFADFEGDNYGDWQIEGEAFGVKPASGTLPMQQKVSGFRGRGLVNTYLGGNDRKQGKLVSPPFQIKRPYLSFLVGGGSHERKTCIQLMVGDQAVRTAHGSNNERLQTHNWHVKDLIGKQARIEIIDAESGAWGHINIDQIEFRDTPMADPIGDLHLQADYGSMSLAIVGDTDAEASASLPAGKLPEKLFKGNRLAGPQTSEKPLNQTLRGAVAKSVTLQPGETAAVTLVVSWCMPNMFQRQQLVGNYYANRFRTAAAVARYVVAHYDRLDSETRQWRDVYYDSTLPWWLLDRLHATVANLATTTCQRWKNGRFWAWEGCGCCHGTCGHVWNYAHALARLFPTLERTVRDMQDFAAGIGFDTQSGAIRFRGEGWERWAGDAQGGYILKAYREHQLSADQGFLKRNWPQIRRATEFLIEQDGNADGLIEGRQHQTYDQDYYGANTFVGSLYLAALRAAEEMARELGDVEFAEACRKIFQAGSRQSTEKLFNGEYFIQDVDLSQHPDWQYADGCLADQLFGQGWAHQVGLGYLYPRHTVRTALQSIWKYCWTPDVGPQNNAHKPERWFARPGEGGLFTCTWPKSPHLGPRSTRYRNEVWSGIEYQVAGHMAWEGMLTEALAICRAVDQRYHPAKHNPWNEIECGDHYARALASWGVLIALSGFQYHNPAGTLGFAPRITPENFRSVFTAAEGWGSLEQQRRGREQANRVHVRWGRLRVQKLVLELPDNRQLKAVEIALAEQPLQAQTRQEGTRVAILLPAELVVRQGQTINVTLRS